MTRTLSAGMSSTRRRSGSRRLNNSAGSHPAPHRGLAHIFGTEARNEIDVKKRWTRSTKLDRAVDPAVDHDGLAGKVASLRRTKISAEIADFVRLPHAAHRNGCGKPFELLVGRHARTPRAGGEYLGEPIGHDGTGCDIVHGDTEGREIGCDGLGHDR